MPKLLRRLEEELVFENKEVIKKDRKIAGVIDSGQLNGFAMHFLTQQEICLQCKRFKPIFPISNLKPLKMAFFFDSELKYSSFSA